MISGTVPLWRYLLTAYHAGFAVFTLAILVQYFRKRRSFFLAARFPYLGILQLTSHLVPWVYSELVVPFVDRDKTPCVWAYNVVVTRFCVDVGILLIALRVWGLFRRVFLGKHFAESRARLRTEFNRGGLLKSDSETSVTKPKSPSLGFSARFLLRFSQKWQIRLIKYAIPGVFSLVFLISFIGQLTGTGTQTCPELLDSSVGFRDFRFAYAAILAVFVVAVAWNIRKFRDNFNIYLEIWRYFTSCGILFPIFVIIWVVNLGVGGSEGVEVLITQYVVILYQALILIAGFFPLRDQRNLERKIAVGEFAEVKQIDELLQGDVAALLVFERFMRLEFCEELLEFYHAVAEYRRLHAVSTQPQQENLARIIYAQFIASNAPSQINLPDAFFQRICTTLFGSESRTGLLTSPNRIVAAPIDVFDDAQREMRRLMKIGPFMRYKLRRDSQEFGAKRRDSTKTSTNTHFMVVSAASPEVICIEDNSADADGTPKDM